MFRRSRRRVLPICCLALTMLAPDSAVPQSDEDHFGPSRDLPASGRWVPRSMILQQRFREAEDWTFYHSIDELPPDMRALLSRVAGPNVVGPGESLNTTDILTHRGSTQHLYTAVTDEIGVIVCTQAGWR